jgi:hypothetical protein
MAGSCGVHGEAFVNAVCVREVMVAGTGGGKFALVLRQLQEQCFVLDSGLEELRQYLFVMLLLFYCGGSQ